MRPCTMKTLPISAILIIITHSKLCLSANYEEDSKNSAVIEDKQPGYVPHGPLVKCSFLPQEFVDCEEPFDHKGNKTAKEETGKGCVKFGGSRYEDVERATVTCEVLPDIECFGPRIFKRDGVPCVKYKGHYFATTLIYSILLGFLGMDRFSLAQTGTAVGKLLTLGGVGVWWLVDVVLLVTGSLQPEDSSNWNPYV